ncbi:hypothetical protein PHYPSEUDO_001348 [Phytophthora pseudosyringae]|uniref:DOT1 domain-containing protein n=1 Tax=Phytophthora pseudosyringae TaxID=221518 RepID=A0A8T1WIP6_9STRA|nr:hypothetical protein PHYPSEUDO_001348 [Phytophthora pseudosyringae]
MRRGPGDRSGVGLPPPHRVFKGDQPVVADRRGQGARQGHDDQRDTLAPRAAGAGDSSEGTADHAVAAGRGAPGRGARGGRGGRVASSTSAAVVRSSSLNPGQAVEAVASIIEGIRANDVRQQADHKYTNAGDVLPSVVSTILDSVGPFREADVFLDVGAGVGNILAQVALTTDVKMCIGVELRRDLVGLGQGCIQQQLKHYPRLGKVLLELAEV